VKRHPRERKEVLMAIEYAWGNYPELRLGQLLINAVRPPDSDLYYTEDADLVIAVNAFSDEDEFGDRPIPENAVLIAEAVLSERPSADQESDA
jgi:hypothetical protein